MRDRRNGVVAIVDYGLGNLFSVQRACEHVGLLGEVTHSKAVLLNAAAVILPGVGAFGVAVDNLTRLDLVEVLKDIAQSGIPLLGICLGMQLLMRESEEFGNHRGLGIIDGDVVRIPEMMAGQRRLKVPQVGWNSIHASYETSDVQHGMWHRTLLDGIHQGAFMYFVHSYYCRPVDQAVDLARTRYGQIDFCSAVRRLNIVGCQFHPERSGPEGLQIYRNLAALVQKHGSEECRAGKI